MQRQPARWVGGRAVLAIANDRMTDRSELNADLILASGFEFQFEQRLFPKLTQHAIVRYRQLAALIVKLLERSWSDSGAAPFYRRRTAFGGRGETAPQPPTDLRSLESCGQGLDGSTCRKSL